MLNFSFRMTAKIRVDEAIEFRIRRYRKLFSENGGMTSTFCQTTTLSISAPRNEECSPRAIGAALQQAPCIIRNRPIKAFDQAPLPLHSWPCYRRALAFLSSPPTWRLSLQSLPSSPLSLSPLFLMPRQPRRPPRRSPLAFPHRLSPPFSFLSSSFPLASDESKREKEKRGTERAVRIEVRPRISFSPGPQFEDVVAFVPPVYT